MRGDEAELYRRLSPRVLRVVRRQVRTSTENIEDACHFAWAQFLRRSDEIEHDAALAWVTTTAIREAYKLIDRQQRTASIEQMLDATVDRVDHSHRAAPAERLEQRQRLDLIQHLPERQRRVVLLQAAGLSHDEIAHATGDTKRTVQRQLYRARNTLAGLERCDPAVQRQTSRRSIRLGGSTSPRHTL